MSKYEDLLGKLDRANPSGYFPRDTYGGSAWNEVSQWTCREAAAAIRELGAEADALRAERDALETDNRKLRRELFEAKHRKELDEMRAVLVNAGGEA